MTKTGEIQQVAPVKFTRSFTPDVEIFIEECKKNKQKPTVLGFAKRIGVDQHTIWSWAGKLKKDEKGNVIQQLARPHFYAAIKRLELLQKEGEGEKLNERQELFCQFYTTDRELFGNGVQTYIEVYEPDRSKGNWYKAACSAASQILSNTKVINRINELLEDGGLNDQNVDKQMVFLINQYADFTNKIAAIREYNKLKKRITEKLDLTSKGKQIKGFNYVNPGADDDGTDNADNQANV